MILYDNDKYEMKVIIIDVYDNNICNIELVSNVTWILSDLSYDNRIVKEKLIDAIMTTWKF